MGASVPVIVSLLSKDFMRTVCLSILIASPIVWWAMNRWLQDFAYKVEVDLRPFLFGGTISILAALLTVSYQSLQAARTNPVDSLKDE